MLMHAPLLSLAWRVILGDQLVIFVAVLFHGLLFGGLCAYIASVRNLTNLWFWAGLLFGPFALVAVLATPVQEKPQRVAPLAVKLAVAVGALGVVLGGAGFAYGFGGTGTDEAVTGSAYDPMSRSTPSTEPANPSKTMTDEEWAKQLRRYDDAEKNLSQFTDEQVLAASRGVCLGESSPVQTYLESIQDPRFPPGLARTLFEAASRQRYCS